MWPDDQSLNQSATAVAEIFGFVNPQLTYKWIMTVTDLMSSNRSISGLCVLACLSLSGLALLTAIICILVHYQTMLIVVTTTARIWSTFSPTLLIATVRVLTFGRSSSLIALSHQRLQGNVRFFSRLSLSSSYERAHWNGNLSKDSIRYEYSSDRMEKTS